MIHSKKQILIFSLAIFSALMLQSCDLFRGIFGMPTSKDIAIMSKRIEKEALSQKIKDTTAVIADSLSADLSKAQPSKGEATPANGVQSDVAEDKSAEDKSAEEKLAEIISAKKVSAKILTKKSGSMLQKYYVVAGSFKEPENAGNFAEKIKSVDITPYIFHFKNGMTVVAIGGFATLSEAQQMVNDCKSIVMFREGLWIYDTDKNLHE